MKNDALKRAIVVGTVDMVANDLDVFDEVFTRGGYAEIREHVQSLIEKLTDLRDYLDENEQ